LWTVAGVVLSLGALGFLGSGPSWRAGNSRLWAAPNEETAQAAEPTAAQREQFEAKIRPLLVEQCYACHSAKAEQGVKGGLRLDSRAGLLKGGDSGPAFDPQKPEESLLLQAVRWQGLEMPPKGKLPQASLDALAAWLAEGAPWPAESAPTDAGDTPREFHWDELRGAHWAWRPVVRPVPPRGAGDEVARNPIDLFVLEKLREAGLALSPPAEPAVLLRRACFDLLGLPPTAEQEAWFLSLAKRDLDAALTRLVDELLASPQYGERWGRHWLDVARYADTHGLHLDNERQMWAYRDWVVKSFNRNQPFNEFTIEQLAGDLLPNPTTDQLVATGFNRCNVTTSEGGSIDAEYHYRYAVDRASTTASTWMALTAGCAVCHDHKFDPISQKEF
jgi:cytochrome c553